MTKYRLAGMLFPVAALGLTLALLSLVGCTVSQPYAPEPIPLGTPASN